MRDFANYLLQSADYRLKHAINENLPLHHTMLLFLPPPNVLSARSVAPTG